MVNRDHPNYAKTEVPFKPYVPKPIGIMIPASVDKAAVLRELKGHSRNQQKLLRRILKTKAKLQRKAAK